MAKGFTVTETFPRPPAAVWARLTDFANAGDWMPGVGAMTPTDAGPLAVGQRLTFMSRGKERETRVTALEPGRRIALTSTQGGVTATYTYTLEAAGDGTAVTLDAECRAVGLWALLHPIIAAAMKKSDSSQLANLKAVLRDGAQAKG